MKNRERSEILLSSAALNRLGCIERALKKCFQDWAHEAGAEAVITPVEEAFIAIFHEWEKALMQEIAEANKGDSEKNEEEYR